jgi:hypothetical protein
MATGSNDISAKIAHIEAMRPMIGDEAADAAIAALHPQDTSSSATTSQQQRAGGNITNSPQTAEHDHSTHGTATTRDNSGQNIGVNLGRVTLFSGGTTSGSTMFF